VEGESRRRTTLFTFFAGRPTLPVPGADAFRTDRISNLQEPNDLCEGGLKDMDALVVPVGGTDDIVYSKSTSLQVRAEILF
jgi:hypothetical protein